MKIITITGYKGGVGKSTTAIHLATFLSERGQTVLVDGDPNRTAIAWASRGHLPFTVADERQAMKVISSADYVVIDTPARPDSEDLKELAKGCDLLVLPTSPDIVSLQPMLETVKVLEGAKYCTLFTIVPPPPNREASILRNELVNAGIPVFISMIRRTIGYQKAAYAGIPIRDIDDPRLRSAWKDYELFGHEVLEYAE